MSDEQLHQDELVSAYLDGEATLAEVTEVETSDVLLARVQELRAVRDAVAEPVTPLSADLGDHLIGAALGVADTEAAARAEARVVPPQRTQRMLLAMAAAVIVLAAVVGTGMITNRGGDESEYASTAAMPDAAAEAPADEAPAAEAPAEEMEMAAATPMAEEEPMAQMEMAADEAMTEEPMAEMEMAADEAMDSEEERRSESAAEEAAAFADQDAPAAATTTAAAAATNAAAQADDHDGVPPEQVVDLGEFESLETLFEGVGALWSAALEDGAMADSGACAAIVQEQALELSSEAIRAFVVAVGSEDPVTFDARFARPDDGSAVIVYAAAPDCEIGIHDLPASATAPD
jgi:hypothetical protein